MAEDTPEARRPANTTSEDTPRVLCRPKITVEDVEVVLCALQKTIEDFVVVRFRSQRATEDFVAVLFAREATFEDVRVVRRGVQPRIRDTSGGRRAAKATLKAAVESKRARACAGEAAVGMLYMLPESVLESTQLLKLKHSKDFEKQGRVAPVCALTAWRSPMSDTLFYETPARINDFPLDRAKREAFRSRWDTFIDGAIRPASGPNFYDPKRTNLGNSMRAKVEWTAFPKLIEDQNVSLSEKLRLADIRPNESQDQGEYCEWCVQRDPVSGKIVRVTFTTETGEYFEELWAVDPERVLGLYQQHINPGVQMSDLEGGSGGYFGGNKWNTGNAYLPDRGGSMHMIVGINTIGAAVGVVAGAANSGSDVPGRGGDSFHADPLIALSVTRLVRRANLRVGFTNPVGVYLQEPEFNRFELPAGAPLRAQPSDFWKVVRGRRDRGQALRAVFEVPRELGFTVGDIKIDGQNITHGSLIARTVKSSTYVTPIPR